MTPDFSKSGFFCALWFLQPGELKPANVRMFGVQVIFVIPPVPDNPNGVVLTREFLSPFYDAGASA